MSDMYDRIQALCAERGINITEMCKTLNISRSSLSELKAGRTRQLTLETLAPIAAYFGTTTDYLAGKTDERSPQAPPQVDPELAELLTYYRDNAALRLLFNLAKGATQADLIEAAEIIERNKRGREGNLDG